MDLSADASGSDGESERDSETSHDAAIPEMDLSEDESLESDTDSIEESQQSAFVARISE